MKKTKRISSMALAALLAFGGMGTLSACDSRPAGGSTEKIDKNRTQLYVRNYQGGFGNKWLYNGKDKFEEKYKDVSLEDGKTGVQVMITDVKETPQISNIQNDIYEVYFVEKVNYLYLQKQGVVEDITDLVTATSSYDGKSIESKLSDDQKAFYGVQENGETKYYALPHYMASCGIVYDIDLFEERGYYFAEGYENETDVNNMFIIDSGDTRSAGPDGVKGTKDDGLPATYEDFWNLCEYIYQDGYTALNWGGTEITKYYVTALMIQLMANYQGKDIFMQNFTFEGDMSELVKLDANGKIEFESDGVTPKTETVTLDPAQNNGYEAFRHVSYYYALEFMKTLMDTVGKYSVEANITSPSYGAFAAQRDYVASRFSSNITRQAMLIEGTWWDSEATPYFEANESIGGGKEDCNYGWLPLPKATREQVEKKGNNTMVNTINSLCFVTKGLSEMKRDLAFDFVQMMNSDESLADFTVQTNAFKDFKYDLTATQVESLSPFGQALYEDWKTYDIINPNHNNEQYYNTVYTTDSSRRFAISNSNVFPASTFSVNAKMTAAEYFETSFKYKRTSVTLWNP